VPIDPERIARAATRIDPVFLNTPQFEPDLLHAALGAPVLVKVETVNPIRSFKGRGTDFFLEEITPPPPRVVCASAGNFGQGLAYAARKRGIACDVFAAEGANPLKVERMRALGASVRHAGRDFDAAKDEARAFASREGALFVEDGREIPVAEGAGTIAMELCAYHAPFHELVVPLGNGALLGGMAAWVRAHAPHVRVIGVCARNAPAMERSWRSGTVVSTATASTVADGIAVRVPVPEALAYLHGLVDDIVLVSEHSLLSAVRLLFEATGLLIEPAGAAGVAAVLEHRPTFGPGLIATPLCGGNLTREQRRDLL
jgi:threonine dehydratase